MYNDKTNKAAQKYVKSHMKMICLKFQKTEYEDVILPAIQSTGLPVSTFIKQAVTEKIERIQKDR